MSPVISNGSSAVVEPPTPNSASAGPSNQLASVQDSTPQVSSAKAQSTAGKVLKEHTTELSRLKMKNVELESRLEALEAEASGRENILHSRVSVLEDMVKTLVEQFKGVDDVPEPQGEGQREDGDGDVPGEGEDDDDAGQQGPPKRTSGDRFKTKGKTWNELCRIMACIIAHLYGAQKTTPASVLQFPYPEAAAESNVFYDDEGWPLGKIDNKDQKLFRFDFLDPEGAKSKRNKSQFDILVKYFQQHGKGWNVAYKDYIQSLSVPEVEKIAVYKFKHYAKAEKDRMKPKVPSEDTDGSTTQTQLSRAAASLTQMERKRKALPEFSDWNHPKFDGAFSAPCMPHYEKATGDLESSKMVFHMRIPYFWSPILRELHHAFHNIQDPDPEAAANIKGERLWGEDLTGDDVKPHQAQLLSRRYRTWMIKADVLAEHPNWIARRRVASSGEHWGEPEPAEDEPPASSKRGRDDEDGGPEDQGGVKKFKQTLAGFGKAMENAAEGSKALVEKLVKDRPMDEIFKSCESMSDDEELEE